MHTMFWASLGKQCHEFNWNLGFSGGIQKVKELLFPCSVAGGVNPSVAAGYSGRSDLVERRRVLHNHACSGRSRRAWSEQRTVTCAEKCLPMDLHQVTHRELAPLLLLALAWPRAGHTGSGRRFNVACYNWVYAEGLLHVSVLRWSRSRWWRVSGPVSLFSRQTMPWFTKNNVLLPNTCLGESFCSAGFGLFTVDGFGCMEMWNDEI